jgi:hypothetical protein
MADGAQGTLEILQALAPPHVIVESRSCTSSCGSGPIVMVTTLTNDTQDDIPLSSSSSSLQSSSTKIKRVHSQNNDKILSLLHPPPVQDNNNNNISDNNVGNSNSRPPCPPVYTNVLLQGYRWVEQGNVAFYKHSDYSKALEYYQKATLGQVYSTAVELQNERDRVQNKMHQRQSRQEQQQQQGGSTTVTIRNSSARQYPQGLHWLIQARRNEAICHIQLQDIDAAMLACQSSCNLSRNTCAESFVVLAQIYQLLSSSQQPSSDHPGKTDNHQSSNPYHYLENEAQALEKALRLWQDEEDRTNSRGGGSGSKHDNKENGGVLVPPAVPAPRFTQQNQRRLAALRFEKVQRELSTRKAEQQQKKTPNREAEDDCSSE